MSVNWFNVVGLMLEMVGVIMIWIFSEKITGMLTRDIFEPFLWWLQIGIMLIVFGAASQLLGNFLG